MSGALFPRIKTWVSTEDVTYSDLNAEFNNILNNFMPQEMDDYSATVSQMQLMTDAGEVGTESQATSLAGEIERLRFEIKALKGSGSAQWYSAPPTDLTSLNSSIGGGLPPNRVVSGAKSANSSQGLFLQANGAAKTLKLIGTATHFVYEIAGTQYTVSADTTITNLTAAPASQNTCLVNDAGMGGSEWTKYAGEYGSSIIVDTMGTSITALVGKLAGFKVGSTEYFIARVISSTELAEARRGYFYDSTNTAAPRIGLSDNDTITLMKLSWIFATTGGALTVSYNEPIVSGTAPDSPATGDYWYDSVNSVWKVYNATVWNTANATLIGACLQDTTNTVASRSFDFYASVSGTNDIELFLDSTTRVRAKVPGGRINVFGNQLYFERAEAFWDISLHLVSGLVEAADTLYYCYLTETGAPKIDVLGPYDRPDLLGYYHPNETWRSVGHFYNNNSSDIELAVSYHVGANFAPVVTQFVASSAINLRLHSIPNQRLNIPKDGGGYTSVPILPKTKLTVSSGSTLGLTDAQQGYLNIYAMAYGNRAELAIANRQTYLDGSAQSPTAEGGAGAADSATVLYATAARTSVPVKLLARGRSGQTTAGTWAAILTPFLPVLGSFGYMNLQVYTTTPNTWTKPERLKRALVIITGAGGGGGGTGATGIFGGGGAGGTAIKLYSADAIPDSVTITLNAGGTAGSTAGGVAGTGGTSTFGSLLTANGGLGGGGSVAGGYGGLGGTATGGDINLRGNTGGYGCGGGSFFGGSGDVGTVNSQGGTGLYGGGGGGARSTSGGASGGVGGVGICLILELME